MQLLTTKEAAAKLSVTPRRIVALIQSGRLPADKIGRDYLIKEKDLDLVVNRKAGRPGKNQSTK
jgi:excisionase family DNA binding protein